MICIYTSSIWNWLIICIFFPSIIPIIIHIPVFEPMHHRYHNISIAERNLSKNKKYYSYRTVRKDKENIVANDIQEIIEKLSKERNQATMSLIAQKRKNPLSVIEMFQNNKSSEKLKLAVNSSHFFEQGQQETMMKKDVKKQVAYYMSKLKQPIRSKCSLYQQYLSLSQETNDYLEYYLTNFTGEDPGKATQLLKQEGKTIILLILRKKYKCFEQNHTDINNRVFLSFNLNPLNDFQFVSWQKFMRIRKLISGDFNRRDCTDFLLGYFFIQSTKTITGRQFWLIFNSVMRKLSPVLDLTHLEMLIHQVRESLIQDIPEQKILTQEDLQQIIKKQPMFIWHEFVGLIFM